MPDDNIYGGSTRGCVTALKVVAAAIGILLLLTLVLSYAFLWGPAPLGRTVGTVDRTIARALPPGTMADSVIGYLRHRHIEHRVVPGPPEAIEVRERAVWVFGLMTGAIDIDFAFDSAGRLVRHKTSEWVDAP